jgi:hypothetical protein
VSNEKAKAMSDIFISYARPDRERVRQMAAALEQRGWSVWWDHEIPPGRNFDDVIEEALAEARCVVVLWSQASTASGWVRNEASEAMQREVLIPALIDADVKIPLEFRRLQAADLSRWHGEDSAEFRQFCDAVATNVAAAPGPRVAPPVAPPVSVEAPRVVAAAPAPPAQAKSSKALWIGGGFALLVLAGLASVISERDGGGQPTPAVRNVDPPMGNVTAPIVATNPAPNGAVSASLSWRDHALGYAGILTWDGRSATGHLSVDVIDMATQRSLGHREVSGDVRLLVPGRSAFSTQIGVNGDSQTPGAHSHTINLVFEQQQNGMWQLVRNCGDLNVPSSCFETRH